MVLGAIDQHVQRANPKTEPAVFKYDELQIEHIMPQAWHRCWPLAGADEAERVLEAQRRDEAVHQFGNLTLVTSTFNSSVSHSGWDVKQPEFKDQSKLQLNHSITACPAWDVHEIRQRGTQLAALAAKVWPN